MNGGYTLPEMLVALVLAGLATAGLAFTTRNLVRADGRVQTAAAGLRGLARLESDLGGTLRRSGPFGEGAGFVRLEGDSQRLSFDCGAGARCGAEIGSGGRLTVLRSDGVSRNLALGGRQSPTWRFVSALDGRVAAQWPPADRPDRLGAVVLFGAAGPLAVFPTVVEQPARCNFDARLHACAGARS